MGYLSVQRDLYAYLHDQTLRMLNAGMTGAEIAEAIVLPPALECAWHARGYYGSVSHNVKAIYQRYMGLGFGAENGTWRCIYLAGATELRQGNFGTPTATAAADLMRALSPEQIFDAIAIRVDGPKAWGLTLSIGVELADSGEQYRLDLRNGVLVHRLAPVGDAALIIRTSRAALPGLLAGQMGGINLEGDPSVLGQLLGVLQTPDPDFSIVTP